jgi:hypothetical protein
MARGWVIAEFNLNTHPRGGGAEDVHGEAYRVAIADLGKRRKELWMCDAHGFSEANHRVRDPFSVLESSS